MLPDRPGLARRMAYGRIVNNRNNRNNSDQNYDSPVLYHPRPFVIPRLNFMERLPTYAETTSTLNTTTYTSHYAYDDFNDDFTEMLERIDEEIDEEIRQEIEENSTDITELMYNPGNVDSFRRNMQSPIDEIPMTYEQMVRLSDIKVGLIDKRLVNSSKVSLSLLQDAVFCVICQESIECNAIIRTLECSHCYHINCIDNWFTDSSKCPSCRYEM